MAEVIVWVAAAAAAAAALYGLLRLALRNERRGWTSEEFEHDRRAGSTVGNAFLAVQSLFEPDKRHVVDARRAEEAEDIETGAPPDPGSSM